MKPGIILLFIVLPFFSYAQEFFPNTESASNLPKGALSVKLANEVYKDETALRFWQGYTLAYGISSKIMISETLSFSNHHGYQLPNNFIETDGSGNYFTMGNQNGKAYPYTFENIEVELKYRFLNIDGEKKHFRMAGYLQLAGGNQPHTTSEPDLLGDNSGLGTGIIATWLINRFAMSGTFGVILPHEYIWSDSNTIINYGNALTYNFSFGYLLLPRKYTNYKQVNLNLYMEFIGEAYKGSTVSQNGRTVNTSDAPSFSSGSYLEARPGIQLILLSNTRIDFSIATLIEGHSYERQYPLYYFNLQHFFYL